MAAYSATPDNKKGDFSFEVDGAFKFGTSPVFAPSDVLCGAFDFSVVLVGGEERKAEKGGGKKNFEHDQDAIKIESNVFPSKFN